MSFFIFVFPWVYNSSIALKMLLHCPLICNESSANSKVILTFVPLYKNVFLFLAPFKVFSLLLLLSSLNVMCHGVFFFLFWCLWVVELRGYWVFIQFSSVQSLSGVWLFVTPWTAACQASLSITNSQSLRILMSIKSVMLSNHLILCRPLLLLPSIFSSIKVFSNESALHQVAKVLEFQLQHQAFQWIFRTDFL